MAKPYAELRGLLVQNDMDQKQLARRLQMGLTSLSARMNAHQTWELSECYAIMDLFEIPHERLHQIFPPIRKQISLREKSA